MSNTITITVDLLRLTYGFNPTDLGTAFGAVLRSIRQERGFSQEKVALVCKVDRKQISEFEQGIDIPTIPTLMRFAVGLDVDPRSLVCAAMEVLYALHKGRHEAAQAAQAAQAASALSDTHH